MEIIKQVIEMQSDRESYNLYFLGDIHEGNSNHDEEAFEKAIEIIEEDERGLWVGMGDMIDAINHHDPRFNPIELAKKYNVDDLAELPQKQIENLYKKLKPIENKCIALLMGNHEESYVKHNAFNPMSYLKKLMSSHPPILGYTGFVKMNFKRFNSSTTVVIDVQHGTGGGGFREGYPINKIHDISRYILADVHVIGHLHRMSIDEQRFLTTKRLKIETKKVLYGTNGCFIDKVKLATRGYFEGKAGGLSSIGMLKLQMDVKRSKNTMKCNMILTPIFTR